MAKDDVQTQAPPTRTPRVIRLLALDAAEVLPGAAGSIPTNADLELPAGCVGIVFPEVLQLAGPQAASVVIVGGPVAVPVFNMNPTRRLTVGQGEPVGSLIVVRLA
jgi:hypothetical protein